MSADDGDDQPPPIGYGDLRITSDRRVGSCLFWVVPDVSQGFNVPEFYEQFRDELAAERAWQANGGAEGQPHQQQQPQQQEPMSPPAPTTPPHAAPASKPYLSPCDPRDPRTRNE